MRNLGSGMRRLGKSLAIGTGLTLATFTSAFFLDRAFPTGNLANWVQGIGSILAIIGVVWTTSAQTRASIESVRKNLDWSAEMQRRAAMAVVDAAKDRVEQITMAIQSEKGWQLNLSNVYVRPILDSLSGALRGFPAHQLPTSGAVAAFLLLQQHLIFIADNTDALIAGPWSHPYLKVNLQGFKESLELTKDPAEVQAMNRAFRASVDVLKSNVHSQAKLFDMQVETFRMELGL